ncbi:unnamed protein product [Meganyctiphanes norvegica]|uniref:Right handed beta helix domain-containing protein n=1 Tax=Meganyctiphanes norvegica TaxID=48144 RepID=A0AAV2S6X9_MEGNR
MVPLLVLLVAVTHLNIGYAASYVVDGDNGDNMNTGLDEVNAFKTISYCIEQLLNPGDECLIRSGRYHEEIEMSGFKGTEEKPFIIAGYKDECPIWDGTVPIYPDNWEYDELTGICSATIDQFIDHDIFALLLDDDLLTSARWPNALWSDKTIFNNSYWGKAGKESSYGNIFDDGQAGLAESGIDATGTMAILNIGSWMTYVKEVLDHERGTQNFTYNHDMGEVHWVNGHLQYYLEAGLELLDAPGEWYFDNTTKVLYVIMPDYQGCPDPHMSNLRGRTIDYGLTIWDSTGITISDIDFIAANIKAYSVNNPESHVDLITLDSLRFKFPSSSHRMLKSDREPHQTRLTARNNHYKGKVTVYNCTFEGSDGVPLIHDGTGNVISNNLFVYNDWVGQDAGAGGVVHGLGSEEIFSRNTFLYNGATSGLRPGIRATIEYNHIVGQCEGLIQNDGAGIHIQIPQSDGVRIYNNWVHDSPKYAIRYDSPGHGGSHMGRNGYTGFNVQWNTGSIMVKGDNHTIESNTALDRSDPKECTLCVIYRLREDPTIENNQTIVINNGGIQIDGGKNVEDGSRWPVPGEVVENNYSGHDVKSYMVDPTNLDFRPIVGGVLDQEIVIGAYAPGLKSARYWIPGRQIYKASMPIPPNGATVPVSRDALMFLEGNKAEYSYFYLGTGKNDVDNASTDSAEFQFTFNIEDGNILQLPELNAGTTYYWRVDSQRGEDIFKGDIWEFSTEI